MKTFETWDAEETYNIGKTLGERVKAGDVVCLTGELGVGKTVFTQGFAEGLGIKDAVSSPTFTIIQEMKGEGFRYTILMFTVSAVLTRWTRSDLTTIYAARVYV